MFNGNTTPPKFGKGKPLGTWCTCRGGAAIIRPLCDGKREGCPYNKKATWPKETDARPSG